MYSRSMQTAKIDAPGTVQFNIVLIMTANRSLLIMETGNAVLDFFRHSGV